MLGLASRLVDFRAAHLAGKGGAKLDHDIEFVEPFGPAKLENVVRRQSLVLGEHRLDLRRKHIDAANDQHVVAAASRPARSAASNAPFRAADAVRSRVR